jgi:hypothetical protein
MKRLRRFNESKTDIDYDYMRITERLTESSTSIFG